MVVKLPMDTRKIFFLNCNGKVSIAEIITLDFKRMLKYLWNGLTKAKYRLNCPHSPALFKYNTDVNQHILKR